MSAENYLQYEWTPKELVNYKLPDMDGDIILENDMQDGASMGADVLNVDCKEERYLRELSPDLLSSFDFTVPSPTCFEDSNQHYTSSTTVDPRLLSVTSSSIYGETATASLPMQDSGSGVDPTYGDSTLSTAEGVQLSHKMGLSKPGVPLHLSHLNLPEVSTSLGDLGKSIYRVRITNSSKTAQVALKSLYRAEKMLKLHKHALKRILGLRDPDKRKLLPYDFKTVKTKGGTSYDVRLLEASEVIREWGMWQTFEPMKGDAYEVTLWTELNPVSRKQISLRKTGMTKGVWIAHFNTEKEKRWIMIASNAEEAVDIMSGNAEKSTRNHIRSCFKTQNNPENHWRPVYGSYHVKRVESDHGEPQGRMGWRAIDPKDETMPCGIKFCSDSTVMSHSEYGSANPSQIFGGASIQETKGENSESYRI